MSIHRVVRTVGFLVLAGSALAVALLLEPETPEAPSHSDAIAVALADADTNERSASSAPQQQVVNGWVARDLLTVIARQNDALLAQGATDRTDPRPAWLLVIAVLAICWAGLTTPVGSGMRTATVPGTPTAEQAGFAFPPPPPPDAT
ncbi:MAG: hypothetical protein WHS89_13270 [Acidimicrobiales bacterium]